MEKHRTNKKISGLKKVVEIADINKCVSIFDVSRFTERVMLKKILLPQITKKQKAVLVVAAIER